MSHPSSPRGTLSSFLRGSTALSHNFARWRARAQRCRSLKERISVLRGLRGLDRDARDAGEGRLVLLLRSGSASLPLRAGSRCCEAPKTMRLISGLGPRARQGWREPRWDCGGGRPPSLPAAPRRASSRSDSAREHPLLAGRWAALCAYSPPRRAAGFAIKSNCLPPAGCDLITSAAPIFSGTLCAALRALEPEAATFEVLISQRGVVSV